MCPQEVREPEANSKTAETSLGWSFGSCLRLQCEVSINGTMTDFSVKYVIVLIRYYKFRRSTRSPQCKRNEKSTSKPKERSVTSTSRSFMQDEDAPATGEA